jgi:hypothetical protein
MRKTIFVTALLLLLSTAAFAQHASEPLGGSFNPDKPPATKKPPAKSTSTAKPLYSPCGVYYKSRAEMMNASNLTDKWYSLGQSANTRFGYNPRRTTCDGTTTVLKSWIKEEHKNTDGEFSLVLYEIKCKANQLRIKTVIDYDKTGAVLQTTNRDEETWHDVAPSTAGEFMLHTLCRRP